MLQNYNTSTSQLWTAKQYVKQCIKTLHLLRLFKQPWPIRSWFFLPDDHWNMSRQNSKLRLLLTPDIKWLIPIEQTVNNCFSQYSLKQVLTSFRKVTWFITAPSQLLLLLWHRGWHGKIFCHHPNIYSHPHYYRPHPHPFPTILSPSPSPPVCLYSAIIFVLPIPIHFFWLCIIFLHLVFCMLFFCSETRVL